MVRWKSNCCRLAKFDLRYWKRQVPADRNGDGKNDSHDERSG